MRNGQAKRCECETLEPRRLLAAGPAAVAFDLNFGDGGRVNADLVDGPSPSPDYFADAAPTAAGGFVMVGSTQSTTPPVATRDGAVLRLTADGRRDASFGDNGLARFPSPASHSAEWHAVVPLADGRLLVGGSTSAHAGQPWISLRPAIARLNADGSLDTTFGPNGTGVIRPFVQEVGGVNALAVLDDGSIVAGGIVGFNGGSRDEQALWRFNPDGTPDAGFGAGGYVTRDVGIYYADFVNALQPLSDGRLLARRRRA